MILLGPGVFHFVRRYRIARTRFCRAGFRAGVAGRTVEPGQAKTAIRAHQRNTVAGTCTDIIFLHRLPCCFENSPLIILGKHYAHRVKLPNRAVLPPPQ